MQYVVHRVFYFALLINFYLSTFCLLLTFIALQTCYCWFVRYFSTPNLLVVSQQYRDNIFSTHFTLSIFFIFYVRKMKCLNHRGKCLLDA